MNNYRKLVYENSRGDKLQLNTSSNAFLWKLNGMGYSYNNEIISSSYDTYREVEAVEISQEKISGEYVISADNLSSIYEKKTFAEEILNYDQVLNRTRRKKTHGKLYCTNGEGRKVYCYALVSEFRFGEVDEDGDELTIDVSFDMITKNWISSEPLKLDISFEEDDQYCGHRYGHPFGHVAADADKAKKWNIAVGGTDTAYIVMKVYGEVGDPSFELENTKNGNKKTIKYKGVIPEGAVLTLSMIDLKATLDGTNVFGNFDIDSGDIPFFPIIPGEYKLKIDSNYNRGKVEVRIYESYASG